MKKKFIAAAAIGSALTFGLAGTATAAVLFDEATGTGFVGKGDVQLAYGWNNKALQDNAAGVSFSYEASTETTWTCTKLVELGNGGTNEIVQERNTSTSTTGIVSSVARENSKGKDGPVTGFNLNGWSGSPVVNVDGQPVGTCPANPSGFVFDEESVETTTTGGGLVVTFGGVSHSLQ